MRLATLDPGPPLGLALAYDAHRSKSQSGHSCRPSLEARVESCSSPSPSPATSRLLAIATWPHGNSPNCHPEPGNNTLNLAPAKRSRKSVAATWEALLLHP